MDDSKPSNSARLDSPSYRLAAMDQDFLLGDTMRGVRFLLEYAKAEEHLRLGRALHRRRVRQRPRAGERVRESTGSGMRRPAIRRASPRSAAAR